MLKEREIKETFQKLGLSSDRERQIILSQGLVYREPEKEETPYWLVADINSEFKISADLNKGPGHAGLE